MSSKNAEIAALKAQLAKIQGYALGGGVGGDGNMVLEPMRQDLPQIVSQVFIQVYDLAHPRKTKTLHDARTGSAGLQL